jgi:hypothetical protein
MGEKNIPYFVSSTTKILFSFLHTSLVFSNINISLLMNVGIYLCKSLIFYWCNTNEMELILNLNSIPNSWEVSIIKCFANLKTGCQTYTKWFMGNFKKTKTKNIWSFFQN